MTSRRRAGSCSPAILTLFAAGVLSVLGAIPVAATVGLAEWTVLTPGGHLISHADGWKETHGDCLRGDETVFVSHLRRWRYYPGHVIGATDDGFFAFDEKAERVTRFAHERGLLDATRAFGDPLSPWLQAGDGWLEAWFPFVVWGPCSRGQQSMANVGCEATEDSALLDRYRSTTWGSRCRQMRASGRTEPALAGFCEELLAP